MKRRLLSLCLALALCLGMLPVSAFAKDGTLVATVEIGSYTQEYRINNTYTTTQAALQAAWNACQGQAATLTLHQSVTLTNDGTMKQLVTSNSSTYLTLNMDQGVILAGDYRDSSNAVLNWKAGGSLTLASGTIQVTNNTGTSTQAAIQSSGSATIRLSGGTIKCINNSSSTYSNAYGVYISAGTGTFEMTGGAIVTDKTGDSSSDGVHITASGSTVKISGGTISGDGCGVNASGSNIKVSITDGASINYSGNQSAVEISNGANAAITGGTIESKGNGIKISGNSNSTVEICGSTKISSSGSSRYGISASYGNVTISDGVEISSSGGGGIQIQHGAVTVSDDVKISVSGYSGEGIYAGTNGIANVSGNVTISNSCSNGYGIEVDSSGKAQISGNVQITSSGSSGTGIRVNSTEASCTVSDKVTINSNGTNGNGISVESGTVTVSGTVQVEGEKNGVYVAGSSSTVTVEDNVQASGGENGIYVFNSGNAQVSGEVKVTGTQCGIYVTGSSSTAEVSGDAQVDGEENGIYVTYAGTAEVSGNAQVDGEKNGIYVEYADSTATVSGSALVTGSGSNGSGIYVNASGTAKVSETPQISGTTYGLYVSNNGSAQLSGGIYSGKTSVKADGSGKTVGGLLAESEQQGLKYAYYQLSDGRQITGTGVQSLTEDVLVQLSPPTELIITRHPVNVSVVTGHSASFTVVAIGPGSLSYQWQEKKGDSAWEDIPAATAATYTITATNMSMDGWQYRCVVKDAPLTEPKTSNAATLTVTKNSFTATVSMESYTYGETPSTPSVSGNISGGVETYYYSTTYGTSGNKWENITGTSLDAGTYYMYAVIAETSEYSGCTTAPVTFTVKRAVSSISETPVPNTLTYNGNPQELVSALDYDKSKLVYSLDELGPYETGIPTGIDANDYTVYYKVEGSGNYCDSEVMSVTAGIQPKPVAAAVSGSVTKEYDGGTDVPSDNNLEITVDDLVESDKGKVTATAESYSYDTEKIGIGKTITATGIVLGGDRAKNYTLESITATGDVGTITKIQITELTEPGGQTLQDFYEDADKVIATLPQSTQGTTSAGTVNISLSWKLKEGSVYNGALGATNTFTWTATVPDEAHYVFAGDVKTSGDIVVTNKSLMPVTITGQDKEVTYNGQTIDVSIMFDGIPAGISPNYFIVSGNDTTGGGSLDGSQLTVTKAGTFQIKVTTQPVGNYAAGEATATLTVNKGSFTATVSMESYTYGETPGKPGVSGNISDGDVTYYYSTTYGTSDGNEWKNITSTSLAAGTYYMYAVIAETDLYHSCTTSAVEFKVQADAAAVTKTPTAKKLTYNGTAQELVTAGEASGGTMVYSLDGEVYTGDIPTGLKAGSYTVYYKVSGDDNHGDTEPGKIPVTIAQAALTVSGVTAGDKPYDGSNEVTITGVTLDGIMPADGAPKDEVSVKLENLTGTVSSADAGTYKEVTLPELELAGDDADNYTLTPPANPVALTGGVTIAPADRTIDGPTQETVTFDSVTLNAVTVIGDGTVQYAKSSTDDTPTGGWQAEPTFDELTPATTYYFFAQVTGGTNYQDATSNGTKIRTKSPHLVLDGSGAQVGAFDTLAGAFDAAKDGYTVVLGFDDALTQSIPANVTLRVPEELTLTVASANLSCLSAGALEIQAGGALVLDDETMVGGANAGLNLKKGSVILSGNILTLKGGAEAEVPKDQSFYLTLGTSPLEAVVEKAATLTVADGGTFGAKTGSRVKISGTMEVNGALSMAQGAEAEVTSDGWLKLNQLTQQDIVGDGLQGTFVINAGGMLSYNSDVLIGTGGASMQPMVYLTSGTAKLDLSHIELNLAALASSYVDLTIDGDASIRGQVDLSFKVVASYLEIDAPIHLTLASGTSTIESGAVLKLKNGSSILFLGSLGSSTLTVEKEAELDVKGTLTVENKSSVSGSANVSGKVYVLETGQTNPASDATFILTNSGRVYAQTSDLTGSGTAIPNAIRLDSVEDGYRWMWRLGSYTVTYDLINLTQDTDAPTGVAEDGGLEITLTADSGHTLPETISVIMGGATLEAGTGYTYNSTTGAVTISDVTGNVQITAIAAGTASAGTIKLTSTTDELEYGTNNVRFNVTVQGQNGTELKDGTVQFYRNGELWGEPVTYSDEPFHLEGNVGFYKVAFSTDEEAELRMGQNTVYAVYVSEDGRSIAKSEPVTVTVTKQDVSQYIEVSGLGTVSGPGNTIFCDGESHTIATVRWKPEAPEECTQMALRLTVNKDGQPYTLPESAVVYDQDTRTYTVMATEAGVYEFAATFGETDHFVVSQPQTSTGKITDGTFTITFDPCGGSVEPVTMSTEQGKLASLPTPTLSGYRFDGWFEKQSDYALVEVSTTSVFYQDTTVYAHWIYAGSSGSSTYTITVVTEGPGEAETNVTRAVPGRTITITAAPEPGYKVERITVTTNAGKEIAVENHQFIMPAASVTVTVTFSQVYDGGYGDCPKDETCPIWPFTDAITTAWYHDGVHFCLDNGLMEGYGNGLFGPEDDLSRAMLVQILYNREGRPAVSGGNPFDDVADGTWYADAVTWAASRDIVLGYGDGNYGPEDPITREQLATILFRYAVYRDYDVSVYEDTNILSFTDAFDVSEWAISALQWTCGTGIIQGTGDGSTLSPLGKASRAEAATMLMRFCMEYGAS